MLLDDYPSDMKEIGFTSRYLSAQMLKFQVTEFVTAEATPAASFGPAITVSDDDDDDDVKGGENSSVGGDFHWLSPADALRCSLHSRDV